MKIKQGLMGNIVEKEDGVYLESATPKNSDSKFVQVKVETIVENTSGAEVRLNPKNSEWKRFEATNPRATLLEGYLYFREEDIKTFLQERSKDTVGELIEKCGVANKHGELNLYYDSHEWVAGYYEDFWGEPRHQNIVATGETPLEALQKLSEQLNQK